MTNNRVKLANKKETISLLLLFGLVLIFASFFQSHRSFDLHLHDTYFVISNNLFYWFFAVISQLLWLMYVLANKILFSKSLTWVYVIITMLTILLFVSPYGLKGNIVKLAPRLYYDLSAGDYFNQYSRYTKTAIIIFVLLLSGQIIFVVNIIVGIFKRKK